MRLLLALLLALLPPLLHAAINPAHFQSPASEQLRLREVARVVHEVERDGRRLRRTTLVAEVVEVRRATAPREGTTIVIDFTVDLDAREAAARAHSEHYGQMPGPQFLGEPDPPVADAEGLYWANLAPLGGRLGNVNREAGAEVGIGDYATTGEVFVPVGGPYAFMAPMD